MAFTIKDVAGVVHGPFNLSKDPRGVAMDASPPGLRRRPARDQELDNMVNQVDEETAFGLMCMFLDRFPDLKERLDRLDAGQGENNGNGNGGMDRRRANDTPPTLKGMPKPGGGMDSRLASDSRIPSIEQMAPGFDKVGTGDFVNPVF